MERNVNTIDRSATSGIEINKVLRNTYMLLGMTLVFSGVVAYLTGALNLPVPRGWFGIAVMFAGFYGLLFAIEKTKNSPMGLVLTFVFTGFLGYIMGPVIAMVSAQAPQVLMMALAGTGLTFFGLSAYVLVTRKDMSFLGGTLMAGFWVLMIAVVANLFLQIPAVSLAISAAFVLFSSMIILWQTSAIIHGGERNYISATVTLFVAIYNLFSSLLHLLLAFAGDD